MRKIVGAAGLATLALALTACGSSSSSSATTPATTAPAAGGTSAPAASGGSTVNMTTINGTAVLTNSAGKTLYWFAPDTSTASKCTRAGAPHGPPGDRPGAPG